MGDGAPRAGVIEVSRPPMAPAAASKGLSFQHRHHADGADAASQGLSAMGSSGPQTGATNLVNALAGALNSSNIAAKATATDGTASTTAATQGSVRWRTIDATFAPDLMSATWA
jgi:hypothetical protein